jgi:hypothetical protein
MDDLKHPQENLLGKIKALPIISRESLRARAWPKVPPRRAVFIRHTAEKVVQAAIRVTRVNGKNISELAARAELNDNPKGLRAHHSWRQGIDAWGTDTFWVFRVGRSEFWCWNEENYGN